MQVAQTKILFHPPGWKRLYLFLDIFLFLAISVSGSFVDLVSFRITLSEREAPRAGSHLLFHSGSETIDWGDQSTLYLHRLFLLGLLYGSLLWSDRVDRLNRSLRLESG